MSYMPLDNIVCLFDDGGHGGYGLCKCEVHVDVRQLHVVGLGRGSGEEDVQGGDQDWETAPQASCRLHTITTESRGTTILVSHCEEGGKGGEDERGGVAGHNLEVFLKSLRFALWRDGCR